uniref:Uncharacterized protein n=1 Tax=Arundo donax TaxID=35708 RepID=A0A0A9CWM4_ARUDO
MPWSISYMQRGRGRVTARSRFDMKICSVFFLPYFIRKCHL